MQARWFGLFRVRSPLLAESLLFSLPSGTEMVHFPELPSCTYVFSAGCSGITRSGFPHSEIPGSKLVCSSPRLIAAYRVLHRLLAPRHSPYALSSLTTSVSTLTTTARKPHRQRGPFNETLRVFSEKNYRLQDIQLSKSGRRLSASARRARDDSRHPSISFVHAPPAFAVGLPIVTHALVWQA